MINRDICPQTAIIADMCFLPIKHPAPITTLLPNSTPDPMTALALRRYIPNLASAATTAEGCISCAGAGVVSIIRSHLCIKARQGFFTTSATTGQKEDQPLLIPPQRPDIHLWFFNDQRLSAQR